VKAEHDGIKLTLTKPESLLLKELAGKITGQMITEQMKLTGEHGAFCDNLYDLLCED